MKSNWNYPTTVWVGENRVSDLREGCKNLNIKRPLFVTDKDLVNLSFAYAVSLAFIGVFWIIRLLANRNNLLNKI